MHEELKPKWRNGVGIMLIMLIILFWALAVLLLSPLLRQLPFFVEMLVYAAAGICWIFPVRPMLIWMETGRWRRRQT